MEYRIVKTRTEDGMYEIDNLDLLDHVFRLLATGVNVKYKNIEGIEHTRRCLWLQSMETLQTMFIPEELMEEIEVG